jgi:hypothetical protein
VCLSHDTLANMLQVNFAMMQYHKYSLTEIENMMPWEKTIYVAMLVDYLQKEEDRRKQQG